MGMDKTLSLGAVWEETLAFCKAEATLLVPLALLGFGLPATVLGLIMPDKLIVDGQPQLGLWMLWIFPHGLFSLLGTLSISALTSRPGISVSEALQIGARRMPAGIVVALMAFGVVMLATLPVGIVAGVEAAVAGKPGAVFLLAYLVVLVLLAWLSLRLLPVWAAIASGQASSWVTVRATLAQTRGRAAQMLVLRLAVWISQFIVVTVVMVPTRAMLELAGRAAGSTRLTDLLAMLIGACVAAATVTLWTVYVAALQRRLAGLSNGM
jgi:hypothetical protein